MTAFGYSPATTIGSLIETLVTLEKARAIINDALACAKDDFREDGRDQAERRRYAFLLDDSNYLDERIGELISQIRQAPTRTKRDALERMRFETLVYADTEISEECAREVVDAFTSMTSPSARKVQA